MNEVAVESKQLKQARLLGRCLAGLLAINLLMVGVAFWTSRNRGSVEAREIAETRQPAPTSPVSKATLAAKPAIAPAKVDSPSSTQSKTSIPKMAVTVGATPPATLPPSIPKLAVREKDPPTKPAGSGLQTATTSLQPLLETASAPDSPISPTPKAQEDSDQEIPAQTENIKPSVLRLVNPTANEGDVHYAVNKVPFSLSPGEYHELPQTAECLVEFHRGGDFGNAELQLQTGDYVFAVGETGWNLAPGKMEPAAALHQAH